MVCDGVGPCCDDRAAACYTTASPPPLPLCARLAGFVVHWRLRRWLLGGPQDLLSRVVWRPAWTATPAVCPAAMHGQAVWGRAHMGLRHVHRHGGAEGKKVFNNQCYNKLCPMLPSASLALCRCCCSCCCCAGAEAPLGLGSSPLGTRPVHLHAVPGCPPLLLLSRCCKAGDGPAAAGPCCARLLGRSMDSSWVLGLVALACAQAQYIYI